MKNKSLYQVNEIFYSLQGEGLRSGTPNTFVRFSGCNLMCNLREHGFDCDTEFTSGRLITADELLEEVERVSRGCTSVIFTGGEPSLQLTEDLVDRFKSAGYYTSIETNGLRATPINLDWVCVSPKTAEHTLVQRTANEVKYVRAYSQGIPHTVINADHYYISPAFSATDLTMDNLKWCIKLCLDNPKWRLSVQQHKSWQVK